MSRKLKSVEMSKRGEMMLKLSHHYDYELSDVLAMSDIELRETLDAEEAAQERSRVKMKVTRTGRIYYAEG